MAFKRRKLQTTKIPPLLVHKWSAKVLDEGFVPFPKRLLRCGGRIFRGKNRLGQLRVLLAIVDYERPSLERLPTIQYLSIVTGISRARVRDRLREMEEKKLVVVTEMAGGLKVDYRPLIRRIESLTDDE